MRGRFYTSREFYIPKHSTKVADKLSDAIAYLYERDGKLFAAIFVGKQAKPLSHYRYRDTARREDAIKDAFNNNRAHAAHKAKLKTERKAEATEFAARLEVGDIFHYSFGYDETHHVYVEVIEIKGRYCTVRKIAQAQTDLGYDYRHRCMPQSGAFIGEPERCLIQDGRILVDRHYHASKWNTRRVAGVVIRPSYTGGGMH